MPLSAVPRPLAPPATARPPLALMPVGDLLDEAYRLTYCLVGPGLAAERVCSQATRGLGLRPIDGAASPLLRWSLLRRIIGHAERVALARPPLAAGSVTDGAGSFAAVWRLPLPERTVIALRLASGLDVEQTARLLRLPVSEVRRHAESARRSMRAAERWAGEPSAAADRSA